MVFKIWGTRIFVILVCIGIATLSWFIVRDQKKSEVSLNIPTRTIFIEDMPLSVMVVDTEEKRHRGLSGHPGLLDTEGMLFVFEEDGYYGIWMKDMLFPIDILWLDIHGRVVHTVSSATPESYPEVFYPTAPARYVLEVSSGFVATQGVQIGDTIGL